MSIVSYLQLKCYAFVSPISKGTPSWGLRMDLAKEQETGPSLSLALSLDPHVLSHDPDACPSASSARAKDDESLGSGLDFELPTSECSSRDDKPV